MNPATAFAYTRNVVSVASQSHDTQVGNGGASPIPLSPQQLDPQSLTYRCVFVWFWC